MTNNQARKKLEDVTHQAKTADKDTPIPPQSSANVLFRFSSARSVTLEEARKLSKSGAFKDGAFRPPVCEPNRKDE